MACGVGRFWGAVAVLLALGVGHCSASSALPTMKFAAAEREPYIGENLLNKGYVHEVVVESLKRAGYAAVITFYPQARAAREAEYGNVDGIAPMYFDASLKGKFTFSDPFPGDSVGLLKRKDMQVAFDTDPRTDLGKALEGLKRFNFGTVRGFSVAKEFDDATYLRKDMVVADDANLKKLEAGRVDLVVIDKLTAADLMVKKFPQMIGRLEFMEPPLVQKPFRIAFANNAKDYAKKLNAFNTGLRELTKDGTLQRIMNKHGLFSRTDQRVRTLVIGTVANGDMAAMQRMSTEFTKLHPETKLEWRVLDENTLRVRLMSDLALSDGQFDVMTIGSYEAPIWGKRKWIIPLENLPRTYDVEDLLKPMRDAVSYENVLYALPFYGESSMIYYRKDLFDKAGLKMPDSPNYKDILEFAATLHRPADGVYGIGLRGLAGWGENMAFLSTLVNTFGGRWFDAQWNPTIDTPEWKSALGFYKNLLTRYGPPDPTANGFSENLKLFSDGHLAMWVDATVAAGMLFNPKLSKVSNAVGIAVAPVEVTPKGSHWLWTWALAIPTSSAQKKEALEFITWATSKDYIKLVGQKEGWVAAPPGTRKSTYENKNYQAAAPFAKAVLNALESANPNDPSIKTVPYSGIQYVGIPEFPAIATQVGQLMAKAVNGEISIDDALVQSQEIAKNQMRASGYTK